MAGNANLQPQRTWEFRATVEHPLLGDGLFKLDLGHDLISKLQDRILIYRPTRETASTRRATSAPASAISRR